MKNTDKILNALKTKLQKRFSKNLKEVILFGSQARGDYSVHSDYDCLVVLDNMSSDDSDIIDEITAEMLNKYNIVISAFIASEKKYKTQIYNPLFMNIQKEGITL